MEIITSNSDGLGSRDIRSALKRIIDIDEDGNSTSIYSAVGNLHLSKVVAIAVDDDGDLVLITEFAQAVMEDLDTWDEFVA